jgi:hypothetical protein
VDKPPPDPHRPVLKFVPRGKPIDHAAEVAAADARDAAAIATFFGAVLAGGKKPSLRGHRRGGRPRT